MTAKLPVPLLSKELLTRRTSFVFSMVALNLAIGAVVSILKLPIYLDSIGIVICAITLGLLPSLLCAALTCGIGFFLINPYLPAYFGTSVVIALLATCCRRWDWFRSWPLVALSGIVIAVGAAVASAPVTSLLFGGATLSGTDAITAFFVSSGHALLESVLYAGLASEPIDKVLVCVIVFGVLRSLPRLIYAKNGLRYYRETKGEDN